MLNIFVLYSIFICDKLSFKRKIDVNENRLSRHTSKLSLALLLFVCLCTVLKGEGEQNRYKLTIKKSSFFSLSKFFSSTFRFVHLSIYVNEYLAMRFFFLSAYTTSNNDVNVLQYLMYIKKRKIKAEINFDFFII